ncbi:MAG TPA: carboxymuconolactone decarboxylase family protein [Actinophytocola sp.]|uniref:carboxymuconolactone decarboxylase family protein n=1 Tax=Actinophytocola sp. TaxID=1872138 RepID=UPI002DBC880E|nr:carboxymuconolactone decarboxylase family protein [Actinophytocola sp.]HEU5475366.1 carboxymuconolactone decarboxylase family protein [Actinophytocola sp.]
MGGVIVRTALRGALKTVRHVAPVRPGRADGLVRRVYRQVERDFGMLAPPIALHSPAPEVLAASWLMLRETLIATGSADRATKEAVATAVSAANACPYCVEVHDATLTGLGAAVPTEPDPVSAWAAGSGLRAGGALPFPAGQAPELVGVAVTFQYLNRMVSVFLGDSPLPPRVPAGARAGARAFLGRFMSGPARARHTPGASLDLLPDAPVPDDLAWAAGSPEIGGAFARAAAAIEAAGHRSVPAPVRALVAAELAGWDGRPAGIDRSWVNRAVADLPEPDRPAGRLALLTAVAAYQVNDRIVAEYRAAGADDRALVELTAWVSLAAARQVGGWIWAGQPYSLG